ncbi:MAG TPA: SIMPL domain-containing protein [Candidatus Competibacteraceae bacterium]|nr:SIMPL domain-containing protein [Candidatus Competibacteraceae bacterium]
MTIRSKLRYGLPLAALLLAGAAGAAPPPPEAHTLEVGGMGEVRARPDVAWLNAGVESRAATARQALGDNAQAVRKLLDELKRLGVAEQDVQTGSLNLGPQYPPNRDYDQPLKPVGYVASQGLRVRVKPVDKAGQVLDALVAAGANQVQGISLALDDPAAVQDAARRAAVADARRRAALYAEAAGVRLGPVLRISEHSAGPVPVPMMRVAMTEAASGVPIAVGENTVSAQVTMVFALEPAN